MYIPCDDKQNYPFCKLKSFLKRFDTYSVNQPTQILYPMFLSNWITELDNKRDFGYQYQFKSNVFSLPVKKCNVSSSLFKFYPLPFSGSFTKPQPPRLNFSLYFPSLFQYIYVCVGYCFKKLSYCWILSSLFANFSQQNWK